MLIDILAIRRGLRSFVCIIDDCCSARDEVIQSRQLDGWKLTSVSNDTELHRVTRAIPPSVVLKA